MRSDSYPHQWGACRRPVIPTTEKPGNHIPLLFRGVYTTGNRENVRTLPEYDRASNIDRDTEDSIKQRLVAALFKFRFDEQEV